MLTLAAIAYRGFELVQSDPRKGTLMYDAMAGCLRELGPVKDQWDIVWGPASFGGRAQVRGGQWRTADDCALFGQRQIAHFIGRNQIVACPTRQRATELQLMLALDQFIDQRGQSNPALLPAGGHRQARKEMSLPGPAVADEDDRLARPM